MSTRSSSFSLDNLKAAIIPHPLVVSADTSVMDAIAQMCGVRAKCGTDKSGECEPLCQDARASCVLVTDANQKIIGIMTERDVVRLSAQQRSLNTMTMAEVMTFPVLTLCESDLTDLFTTAYFLRQHRLRHLPIVDQDDHLLGLITNESLRQLVRPVDLLRLRLASEVMTTDVISAPPFTLILAIAQLMHENCISSVLIVDGQQIPLGIITERDIVQFQSLGLNLEKMEVQAVMSTPVFAVNPKDSLMLVQQIMEQRSIRRVVVTDDLGKLVGLVTQSSLLQVLNPLELYTLSKILEEKISYLEAEKVKLLENYTIELENQVTLRTNILHARIAREKIITKLASKIATSLDLTTILESTVLELRTFLDCDRLLIWQLQPDGTGTVVAESVEKAWRSSLHDVIEDPCFRGNFFQRYNAGRTMTVSNIHRAGYPECYIKLLEKYQVKSNLVVPIQVSGKLWGLLIGHQCHDYRAWQEDDLSLLDDMSVQLAIAIQQATAYQQLQIELAERQRAEQAFANQNHFNQIIAEISSRFVDVSANDLDREINLALQMIGEVTHSDASYIVKFDLDDDCEESLLPNGTVSMTHEWSKPEYPLQIANLQNAPITIFPWANAKLLRREIVNVPNIADLPAEAAIDQVNWQYFNLTAILSVPLIQKSVVTGLMGFSFFSGATNWDEETLRLLQIMAQTIANAQERCQSDQQLYESEERLRLALKAANQGLYDLNVQTGEALVSPEYATMLGYDPSTFTETNTKWIARLHPDDREIAAQVYQDYMEGIIPEYKVEFRQLTKTGEWKWILSLGKIFEWDEAGNPLRMLGTHTDIHAIKQAEKALQSLNQELEHKIEERTQELLQVNILQSAILNSADYSFIATDAMGMIQSWNVAAERMLGYSAAEVIGKLTPAIIHDRQEMIDRAAALSAEFNQDIPVGFEVFVVKARQGQVSEDEWTYIRKDGSRFPVSLSVTALKDANQKITGFLGIAKDISDRKRSEKEILENQRLIQKIADASPNVLYLYDVQEHRNVYCNREIAQVLGYSLEEIQAMGSALFMTLMHPDDLARMPDYYRQIEASQEGEILEVEYQMRHVNGAYRWLYSRDTVFSRDPQGHVKLTIGTAEDITDRKQSEITIQRTADQLAASNRELEAFAYSVSHDLRAPLRAIDGFSNAIMEDYGDQFDDDCRDYFDRIRRNIQRMGMLIDDLLRLSRVSRSEMQYSNINLSTLIQEQLDELQESEPERQIKAIIAPNIYVTADIILMRVAISNLIQNAWKFTSHHPTACIEFGTIQQEGQPVYFVRDDGAGFDMNYAKMLFGVFQRLHNTHEFAGTGIGLATVQRIIHRHGGQVWAEGEVEKGATIYFTVPHSSLKSGV